MSCFRMSSLRMLAALGTAMSALSVAPAVIAQDTADVQAPDEPSVAPTEEAPNANSPPTPPEQPPSLGDSTAVAPGAEPKPSTPTTSVTAFPPLAADSTPASKPQGREHLTTKRAAAKPVRRDSAQAAQGSEPSADAELQPAKKAGSSKADENSGLFGPIRLGPMIGVGLPNLLSFGGLLKVTRYLGGGLNIGLIPTVRVSYYGQATLLYQEYDIYGRIFPFGGGFFLGAGAGYETVKGTMSDKMDTSSFSSVLPPGLSVPNPLVYQSSGTVKTLVLTPQIGYLYTTDIGFSIGVDIGAQVPIAPSQVTFKSQLTLPPGTPQQLVDQVHSQLLEPNNQKVRNTLQTIGRAPLPTINLRVGWLL